LPCLRPRLPRGRAPPTRPARKARRAQEARRSARHAYADSEEAMRFADEMAARATSTPTGRAGCGAGAEAAGGRAPDAAAARRPAEELGVYRSRFIDPVRIAAGVRFWQANRGTLERAEQEFGVPAEIIVGIVGVETIYGQQMGDFRVLDALATLAFDFPDSHPRAAERTSTSAASWSSSSPAPRHAASPLKPRGSYAGAWACRSSCPAAWCAGAWTTTATRRST
jgi:membrane-bound lytic murein transglycosylase B